MGEHLDLTATLEPAALDHVTRCGPCRVAALEARLFPAGCADPTLGHELLARLDQAGQLPDALEAHAERCAACAAELQDARRALDELAAEPLPARALGPAPRVAVSCTYCHDALDRPEAVYCAACLAPQHEACFATHGRCSAPGCAETQVVRPGAANTAPAEPRWRRRLPLALVAVVGGGLGAAALGPLVSNGGRLLPGPTLAPPPAAPLPAAELDPRDAVVATLDGEPIRRRALLHRCALDPTWRALPPGRSTERLRVELQHLEAEVDLRLLLREATRLGLQVADAHPEGGAGLAREADRELDALPPDARAALKEAGAGRSAHQSLRASRALAEAALARLVPEADVVPTADAVHRYYREHLADFRSGGATKFREIVLHGDPRDGGVPEPGPGERPRPVDELAARALRLEAELARPGVHFLELALLVSDDRDPGREQLLETAALGRVLSPPLASVLERMSPGQVTGPVPCVTGCQHAFQLLERTPPRELPLEQVEGEVRRRVRVELVARRRAERVRELRAAARVETPWWVGGDGRRSR